MTSHVRSKVVGFQLQHTTKRRPGGRDTVAHSDSARFEALELYCLSKPASMSQQKSESKREEFRRYLEGTGVLDALTKCLVGLYEEPDKPSDALDFVKQHLHGGALETIEAEALKKEVEELRQRNKELEEQVSQLQAALAKYESEPPETGTS